MVCIKSLVVGAIAIDSALAFAPTSLSTRSSAQTALRNSSDGNHGDSLLARRDILERAAAAAMAGVLMIPVVASAETPAVAAAPVLKAVASAKPALTTDAWAISVQPSTNALSESLGHALMVIDSLNSQANRLGSSPDPAHSLAVLDGMHAQARRLVNDLDNDAAVLSTLKSQAFDLTPPDEEFEVLSRALSNASSVFDGLLSQSKRLASASASEGSARSQLTYMLSVLDGLNAQTRRLDVQNTLSLLDNLNAKAVKALS